jgi:hypothetical protein
MDGQLLTEVKRLALESGRTLTAVIEDALRETVARHKKATNTKKNRLITDDGNGPRPGVCLNNNTELLDIMKGRSSAPR